LTNFIPDVERKTILRVVVNTRSCGRWRCNMLDKDKCVWVR